MNAQQREFKEYLKSIEARLPNLSARVFALRGKMYSGCGFHYSLERQLGMQIVAANDMGNSKYWQDGREGIAARICVEVGFDGFIEDLERAEASAAEMAAETEARARALQDQETIAGGGE